MSRFSRRVRSRRVFSASVLLAFTAAHRYAAPILVAGVIQASDPAVAVEGNTPAASLLFFQDGHEIAPVKQGSKEQPKYHGGIARLATVLQQEKAAGVPADVVFGGDLGGGTLFGAVFQGRAMVDAFNEVGVNVAGFGQHDFDYGVDVTKQNVAASRFPWVSSNLTLGGAPFAGEDNVAIVREVGGVKIGYIGLTLDMETTSAGAEVTQLDYVAAAQAAVKRIPDADVIVALAQFPKADDALTLLREVPEIAVVLREENSFAQEGNDVSVLPDGRFTVAPEGNYGSLARIDIAKTADGAWSVTHKEIQIDATVADDPALAVLQAKYEKELEDKLAVKIACTSQPLTRPQPLGETAAEAFRAATQADIGWVNAGGLRADLPEGDVTMKDALAVFPFDNKVMKLQVTGQQLRAALEQGADSSPQGTSGGYPLLAGATFTYTPEAPQGAKITQLRRADGTAIADTDTFTLAVTNYVHGGGNKVTAFKDATVMIDAAQASSDFDAFVKHLGSGEHSCAPTTPGGASSPLGSSRTNVLPVLGAVAGLGALGASAALAGSATTTAAAPVPLGSRETPAGGAAGGAAVVVAAAVPTSVKPISARESITEPNPERVEEQKAAKQSARAVLADTGVTSGWLALLAVGLILAGAVLVGLRRAKS